MNTTLFADREALTGLRSGDERALERVFREHYVELRKEAEAATEGSVAAASRVVERAFIQVWHEREKFETPEALESFVRDCIRDGAARERSRHALLHQFESHAGARPSPPQTLGARAAPASVDDAWAHVKSTLHAGDGGPTATAETAQRRAEHSRHEAAEHVATIAKRPISWGTVGMLVAGGALAAAGMWALNRTGAEAATKKALAAPDARIYASRSGQRAVVTLLDGSKVTLGPDSRLVVPPRFGADIRAVQLDGTASFVTTPGQERPLDVRARNASITTAGTTFDVSAYPSDETVVVRVRDGQVNVRVGDESKALGAGKAFAVGVDGAIRDAPAQALDEALAWTDDRVVVTGRPLRDVLPLLRRWYGVDIKVNDPALLDRPITIAAPLGSSRDAIAAVEAAGNVKLGWQNETMVLGDAARAKKAATTRR